MIRTRKAGKRALAVGLIVGALASGSAAATVAPVFRLSLHARLSPVAGTAAAPGQFSGTLLMNVGGPNQAEPSDPLPRVKGSVLTWKLSLPALQGPTSATLRLHATKKAPALVRVLCTHCSSTAHGRITLTKSQGLRVATSDASVVVTAASATLRGPVKVSARFVAQPVR